MISVVNTHGSVFLCTDGRRCSIVILFQVGKQFDALLVDTSVPVFDTFARDTLNVSKSYKHDLYMWQSQIEIKCYSVAYSSVSPSLTRCSAELPLRVRLIHAM